MRAFFVKFLKWLKGLVTSKQANAIVERVLVNNFNEWSDLERELTSRLNIYRVANELPLLRGDKELRIEAGHRVDLQFDKEKISHDFLFHSLERLKLKGYYSLIELLARGYRDPKSTLNALINSKKHNKRLLSKDIKLIGVSVKPDVKGRAVYCLLFSK